MRKLLEAPEYVAGSLGRTKTHVQQDIRAEALS